MQLQARSWGLQLSCYLRSLHGYLNCLAHPHQAGEVQVPETACTAAAPQLTGRPAGAAPQKTHSCQLAHCLGFSLSQETCGAPDCKHHPPRAWQRSWTALLQQAPAVWAGAHPQCCRERRWTAVADSWAQQNIRSGGSGSLPGQQPHILPLPLPLRLEHAPALDMINL